MSRSNGSGGNDRFGKSNDNHRHGRQDDADDDEIERAIDELMRRGTGAGGKEEGNPQGGAAGGAINPELLLIAMMGQLMQALLQHKNNHQAPQPAAPKMATPGAELFPKYRPTDAVASASRSGRAFVTSKVASPTKSTARTGNSRTTRPADGGASSSADTLTQRESSGSSRWRPSSARSPSPPARSSSASQEPASVGKIINMPAKVSIKQAKAPRDQAESSIGRFKSFDTTKTASSNVVSKRVSSPPANIWGSPVSLPLAKVNSPAPVVVKTTEEYCDTVSGAFRSSNSRMHQQMDRLFAEHMERQDRDTEQTVRELRRLRLDFTAKMDALMARAGVQPTTTSTTSAAPTVPSNRSSLASPSSVNPSPFLGQGKSQR